MARLTADKNRSRFKRNDAQRVRVRDTLARNGYLPHEVDAYCNKAFGENHVVPHLFEKRVELLSTRAQAVKQNNQAVIDLCDDYLKLIRSKDGTV